MNQSAVILALGFVLGIKHAFDPDHIVAFSTIIKDNRQPMKTGLIGIFWGIGHTFSLLLTGLLVLLLKINIPPEISLFLEMMVGVMLVFLGLKSVFTKENFNHIHVHLHGKSQHTHFHDHNLNNHHGHRRSFWIGIIHGLAGSGALMILVLSTIESVSEGIYYILLFGLGSITAMSAITVLLSLPFMFSATRFPKLKKIMNMTTGIISVAFGVIIIYEIISIF